jgi:hypothetical protein
MKPLTCRTCARPATQEEWARLLGTSDAVIMPPGSWWECGCSGEAGLRLQLGAEPELGPYLDCPECLGKGWFPTEDGREKYCTCLLGAARRIDDSPSTANPGEMRVTATRRAVREELERAYRAGLAAQIKESG